MCFVQKPQSLTFIEENCSKIKQRTESRTRDTKKYWFSLPPGGLGPEFLFLIPLSERKSFVTNTFFYPGHEKEMSPPGREVIFLSGQGKNLFVN